MGTGTTGLIIGSTHPVWLRGFVQLVESIATVRMLGFAEAARPLADLIRREPPDVLVLENRLVAPLRAALGSSRLCPRVVIVGSGAHAGTRSTVGPDCSCAYVSERDSVTRILDVLDVAVRCAQPRAGLEACRTCPVPQSFTPPALPLTKRENEVFVRIGWGQGPNEIARELGVHVKTIETHRESVKRKLGVGSAATLLEAAIAWRDGDMLLPSHAPAQAAHVE